MFLIGLLKKKKKQLDFEENTTLTKDRKLEIPSLIDNIRNDGITFHKDYFEIQTGLGNIKYARSFFVKPSGYPRTVRVGWLDALFQGDDIDVAVHIDPLDRTVAIKKLQDKIDELETVIHSAARRGDNNKLEDAMQKRDDAKFLQRQIKNNQNGLYYVSIIATLYADSLEELNAKSVNIEREVAGESIELLNAYGRQREGFLSTLALGKNYLSKTDRNLNQSALTAIFPHSSSKLNHTGDTMPIGRYGNEYIYFNPFDKKLNNYNMAIFGESGSGKSVFVKQLIGRGPMAKVTKHYIIDVEPEYTALVKALGGIVIPIKASNEEKQNRINPLDIYPERELKNKGEPNEYIEEKININEKIKEVLEFFKVMKESLSVHHESLTAIEIGILNDILEELYTKREITEDPESIYEQVEMIDDEGNIRWGKRYKEMPTISDVYNKLTEKQKEYRDELKELVNIVKLFTKGKAFGLFDGQTYLGETDHSLDTAPIISFDISKLSENGIERPLAQHVITSWIWSRAIKGNPKERKRIIIDEAWMMLKYNSMLEFLQLLSARGRKWNVALTIVSQRYEMFHRSATARDIVSQMNTVAFLKQSDEDIKPIIETFSFSEDVANMIRSFSTGEILLKAGKEIVHFMSEPTPDEWPYLNTNQNIQNSKLIKSREDMLNWYQQEISVEELEKEYKGVVV